MDNNQTEHPSPSSADDFEQVSKGRGRAPAQRELLASIMETEAGGSATQNLRTGGAAAKSVGHKPSQSARKAVPTAASQMSSMVDVQTQDVRG